jgi:2-haloalkanoic acid dehalogenase type II
MPRAFVFDAYGTLFDVHAAINRHRAAAGPDADRFSEIWRIKQLEYSWTLTLAGRYLDFWTLTERALDFAFARFPSVDRALRSKLLDAYWTLEPFPDARPALRELRAHGASTAILSNGSPEMLTAASIRPVSAPNWMLRSPWMQSASTSPVPRPMRSSPRNSTSNLPTWSLSRPTAGT